MNVWLITTGSSDVQVKDVDVWADWYPEIKKALYGIDRKRFTPVRTIDDEGVPYRMSSRVLGLAYEKLGNVVMEQLEFPLLREFQKKLKDEQEAIAQIIVLVTDQSEVLDEDERDSYHCPYWQDTCLLFPVLKAYLQTEFSKAEITPLLLKPTSSEQGLDNWNEVLKLVQQELGTLTIEPTKIYVSHQAGTPAISSAVQFGSLAKFGDRVKFLVSNEYKPDLTGFVESSSYLRGIEVQQAKKLLDRHDYLGVRELLDVDLTDETRILLDAAIQWNFAKFEEFSKTLEQYPPLKELVQARTDPNNWWWTAYEAAYLGVVRLEQGNTVEAMFHSFRAMEGLLRLWVDIFYLEELKQTKHPRCNEHSRWDRTLHTYGQDLYLFLALKRKISKSQDFDIWVFGNQVFKKRNDLFHQLRGLQDIELFEIWRSPNEKQWGKDARNRWKTRILKCLNFVTGATFECLDQKGADGKVASLMIAVHEELKSVIARL